MAHELVWVGFETLLNKIFRYGYFFGQSENPVYHAPAFLVHPHYSLSTEAYKPIQTFHFGASTLKAVASAKMELFGFLMPLAYFS